jgi:hypothetical protein
MSCCGKERQQSGAPASPTFPEPSAGSLARELRSTVEFELLGDVGLTAIGPVTGLHYRFESGGSAVPVDVRDRRGLAAIPRLRELPRG